MQLTKEQQDIWDTFQKVKNHLLTQNCSSVSIEDEHACMYRGVNNTSCAIGCLIPDEIYSPKMERTQFLDLYKKFPEVRPYLKTLNNIKIKEHKYDYYNHTLGEKLKRIHDNEDVENWEEKLHNLQIVLFHTLKGNINNFLGIEL